MPSIDVHAPAGLFSRDAERRLAREFADAALAAEGLAPTPFLLGMTWVYFHCGDVPYTGLGEAADRAVRIVVLAPAGRMRPEQQRELVSRLTELVAGTTGDPAQAERTFVLVVETAGGGWGLAGRTGADLVTWALDRAARTDHSPAS